MTPIMHDPYYVTHTMRHANVKWPPEARHETRGGRSNRRYQVADREFSKSRVRTILKKKI